VEDVATFQKERDEDRDVTLSKSGDKEAFGRLMHKYQISMYRLARTILHSKQDIEDAAQNTVVKAFINIRLLRENSFFKSWLLKILINECHNILRKKKYIYLEEVNINEFSYEDAYTNFELRRAINKLEKDQRIVTLLFYYEDMSLKDIGKTLSIPEGTVKSRLARAKKKLEIFMTEDGKEEQNG
jgi:RNA polymerase sigma-70 factor (ECF subfamily)